jgi:hypothetical protein
MEASPPETFSFFYRDPVNVIKRSRRRKKPIAITDPQCVLNALPQPPANEPEVTIHLRRSDMVIYFYKIPDELNKEGILRLHFAKYGLKSVSCKPEKNCAILEFYNKVSSKLERL